MSAKLEKKSTNTGHLPANPEPVLEREPSISETSAMFGERTITGPIATPEREDDDKVPSDDVKAAN